MRSRARFHNTAGLARLFREQEAAGLIRKRRGGKGPGAAASPVCPSCGLAPPMHWDDCPELPSNQAKRDTPDEGP